MKQHKVKVRTLRKVEREVKIKNVKDMLKSVRVPTDLEVGFTMLGMNEITTTTGYIAKLRELGYTVEKPD